MPSASRPPALSPSRPSRVPVRRVSRLRPVSCRRTTPARGSWACGPDADLGLPAGSNHTIYLADGLYINPFRNVALIGFWSATADSLTLTPIDIRQLATGIPAPELKDVFTQIAWGKPTITQITWLTPDRFQEKPGQEPRRRAKAVHDVTTVHRAAVVDLLQGSWIKPGGATVVFEPDGTFREPSVGAGSGAATAVRGTYDFDAVAGVLRRTTAGADAASRATRILQTSVRAASTLRWTSRNVITIDGEQWTRQSQAPAAATRGWLGVVIASSTAVVVQVQAGSPAERAGLRAGDQIEAVNGQSIQDGDDLTRTIQALVPGTDAVFTVNRNGTRVELRALIGRLPQ